MPHGLPGDHPYLIATRLNQMRRSLGQAEVPLPPAPPGWSADDLRLPPPPPRPAKPRPAPVTQAAVDAATARLTAVDLGRGHRVLVDDVAATNQAAELAAEGSQPATYADEAVAALRDRVRQAQDALAAAEAAGTTDPR